MWLYKWATLNGSFYFKPDFNNQLVCKNPYKSFIIILITRFNSVLQLKGMPSGITNKELIIKKWLQKICAKFKHLPVNLSARILHALTMLYYEKGVCLILLEEEVPKNN